MTGWQPRVCECGHPEGSHARAGQVSLSPFASDVARGRCLANGCECGRCRLVEPEPEQAA
jgi:hypothetical protein